MSAQPPGNDIPSTPGPRTIRMRDVAARAGVGVMTVSRVLNGAAHVREETRARVFRALEELQYRPNPLARALRGSRSYSIGVIVPYLYDPFFASCAHYIGVIAKKHSYSVLLTTSDESADTEFAEARALLDRQVDGLIVIAACNGRSQMSSDEFARTPIIALDRPIGRARMDRVLVENQKGSALAIEHLIQHGHKRICFVGLSQRLYTMQTRLTGYEKTMLAAGLKPESFFEGHSEEATLAYLKRMHRGGATAIFAANGLSSRHALHAIATLNITMPGEMAFIGFDDFEFADILRPALTVVRQPVQGVGEHAAELLFKRLDKPTAAPHGIMLPVELVLRRSCGCHAG